MKTNLIGVGCIFLFAFSSPFTDDVVFSLDTQRMIALFCGGILLWRFELSVSESSPILRKAYRHFRELKWTRDHGHRIMNSIDVFQQMRCRTLVILIIFPLNWSASWVDKYSIRDKNPSLIQLLLPSLDL